MNLPSGLTDHPANTGFIEQEQDEKVELLVRKHWVTCLPWLALSVVGLFLPVVVVIGLGILHPDLRPVKESYFILGILLWYLLTFSFAFENFLSWYYNAYIITNKHMVFINFKGIYSRDIAEHHYDDIQSVSSHVEGLAASFLKIGSVSVEMTGENTQITLEQIPSPELVAERIEDVKDRSSGGGQ